MTVKFWEQFRDQVERETSYRGEGFQLLIEKCEGAPFLQCSLQTFLESLKKKVPQLRQRTAVLTRRRIQQAYGMA